jgi:hypothetical protein
MKQLPGFAEFGVLAARPAVRILVQPKSIPEKLRWRTPVLRSGLADYRIADRSDAARSSTMRATDRHAVARPHLVERFDTTNGAKHHLPRIRGRCAQAEKVNSRGDLAVAGFESPLCSVAICLYYSLSRSRC